MLAVLSLLLITAVGRVGNSHTAQAQNTFTVTSAEDDFTDGDSDTSDDQCDSDNKGCTLREAIEQANATANGSGPDRIEFDLPGGASPSNPHVIEVNARELPNVTEPVIIDGTSEPDYNSTASDPKPVIEIDGANTDVDDAGIILTNDGSTVRDLAVINFDGSGILAGFRATGHTIVGCHAGVRADGTTPAGNGLNGIDVQGKDQIGGTGADDANIIASNGYKGLVLGSAENVTVQGNFIGTNPSGKDLGNADAGIEVEGRNNTIGGTGTDEGNVIAFNDGKGVVITGKGNPIRGNRIYANTGFQGSGFGIDLGDDGRTLNDAQTPSQADDDDGENRAQNFPVIESTGYDAGNDRVTVTYRVDSEPGLTATGASTYPLKVDFYRAETSTQDAEGEAFLGSTTYTSTDHTTGPSETITFAPNASVTAGDELVATATDADGNTSEFSAISSTLPVELARFDATQSSERTVRLTWETASETNNAGFVLQHKAGAQASWSKLGFVKGSGTTTEAQTYRFTAEDLAIGTHRFRLQQRDLDGTTTVHDPVTVDLQMLEDLQLSAPAPNPVQDRAVISFAVRDRTEVTLTLYNTLGQKVRTVYRGTPTPGEAKTARLSTSGLASGVYVLRLQTGRHTKTRRVTVVQ